MSISSEITRITNAVANAYTEANAKGAEMPSALTVANLAQTIASISGGISEEYISTIEETTQYLQIPIVDISTGVF